MVLGIFLFCGGQIAAAFASQVWHLFITLGVMFGTGNGFIFIAILPLASQWFDHKRAMASGLSAAGSGVGGLIFSITTRIIIEKHSIKMALIANGCIALTILIPVTIFIRC